MFNGLCQYSTDRYREAQRIQKKTQARDDEYPIILEFSFAFDPYHLFLCSHIYSTLISQKSPLWIPVKGWILKSYLHNSLTLFFHLSLDIWYFRNHLHNRWVFSFRLSSVFKCLKALLGNLGLVSSVPSLMHLINISWSNTNSFVLSPSFVLVQQ